MSETKVRSKNKIYFDSVAEKEIKLCQKENKKLQNLLQKKDSIIQELNDVI